MVALMSILTVAALTESTAVNQPNQTSKKPNTAEDQLKIFGHFPTHRLTESHRTYQQHAHNAT